MTTRELEMWSEDTLWGTVLVVTRSAGATALASLSAAGYLPLVAAPAAVAAVVGHVQVDLVVVLDELSSAETAALDPGEAMCVRAIGAGTDALCRLVDDCLMSQPARLAA